MNELYHQKAVLSTEVATSSVFTDYVPTEEDYDHALDVQLRADPYVKIIFDKLQTKQALETEFNSRRKRVLRSMYFEEHWKVYSCFKRTKIEALDRLERMFPNFVEVIELCRNTLWLNSIEPPAAIHLPPLLLSGPPGVGKTRFIGALAEALQTDCFSLDLSSLSSGFLIAGGNSTWSDSKPGFVSESVRRSRYANPIIMLDELDKANTRSNSDPLGPLYGLLETHTAREFVDEFLEVQMDVSSVIWVASANYAERIPEPILSRMLNINIPVPTKAQSRVIAKYIYDELLSENSWGKHFSKTLDARIVDLISELPPRLTRLALSSAMANAVKRSAGKLRPLIVMPEDVPTQMVDKPIRGYGIGFLADI